MIIWNRNNIFSGIAMLIQMMRLNKYNHFLTMLSFEEEAKYE